MALAVYFCVATVLTQLLGVGYAMIRGVVTPDRLEHVLAILHGVEMVPASSRPAAAPTESDREQPSLDMMERIKSLKWRDFELRENVLLDTLAELKKLQSMLEEEKDRFNNVTKAFEKQLQDRETGEIAKGRQEFQRIVENMKPKQAKDQMLMKHKDGRIDVVVEVLRGMEESKRAKIVTEFKTAEEAKVLSEVLERIRDPDIAWIQNARKDMKAVQAP
jgi:hypothetical protein